jgi:hypothetical protein
MGNRKSAILLLTIKSSWVVSRCLSFGQISLEGLPSFQNSKVLFRKPIFSEVLKFPSLAHAVLFYYFSTQMATSTWRQPQVHFASGQQMKKSMAGPLSIRPCHGLLRTWGRRLILGSRNLYEAHPFDSARERTGSRDAPWRCSDFRGMPRAHAHRSPATTRAAEEQTAKRVLVIGCQSKYICYTLAVL